MPVVINYKICDLAPECGGIEVCPVKAFFWNEKTKRPDVDNKKCISCGRCSLECPVNAIMVAKTKSHYKELTELVRKYPMTKKELWRERLGCQPGRTKPLATILTNSNLTREINRKGFFVIDVWKLESLDCRLHSVLWDSFGMTAEVPLKKLNADDFPKLAKVLKVKVFPTLLFFKNGQEIARREGYIYEKDISSVNKLLV